MILIFRCSCEYFQRLTSTWHFGASRSKSYECSCSGLVELISLALDQTCGSSVAGCLEASGTVPLKQS